MKAQFSTLQPSFYGSKLEFGTYYICCNVEIIIRNWDIFEETTNYFN